MLFIKSSFTLSLSFHVLVLIYIYMQLFLYVSLKTHESKRSYSMPAHARSNSELADVLLILSPRRHVVSLLLSETYLGHEMIKDHARPPGRR